MGKIEFYTIYGWMRDDLGLSGTELDCYAVIYCLSQGDNRYIAGVRNMMDLLHKSEPTIISALKSLTEKELVVKEQVIVNNVKRCYYKAIQPNEDTKIILGGTLNNLSKGTLNNLRSNNIKENNINIKEKRLSNDNQKSDELFETFWAKYRKGGKQAALKAWHKMKESEKEIAFKTIDDYLKYCKRSNRPLKDCSSYLNQKCYNEDWNVVPEYYKQYDGDNERMKRFKSWMCKDYADLIYHRNPLTFEQASELFDVYSVKEVKMAMDILCKRDIHQYFNIKSGIEKILESDNMGDES